MAAFEHALILLLAIAGLSVVSGLLPVPRPIVYVLGGIGLAFVPGFPAITLDPAFFFLCFLPPLLFSDGWLMPLREFRQARRSILILATGLVILTTVVVAAVAHALVPALPWPMAFALGAVVSPTDAVAVDAITERLSVPTRLTIILKGESLMNDATGLVAFKFALAALAVGTFSLRSALGQFTLVSLGGLGAGLVVGWGVGRLRDLLAWANRSDALIEVTLSLLTPYAAYLAGESVHVSGILAAVSAGLYSGWRDPVRMTPSTRQLAWSVWSTVLFWLNGIAFVLLGLQFPKLLAAVGGAYSWPQLIGYSLVISGAAMALRILWFFPGAYLPFLLSRRVRETETAPSWRAIFVGGWAGIRGAVTLAAALSIPLMLPDGRPFPGRSLVIFLSFGVIAATLLIQGTTLETLIQRLGLHADGTMEREEHQARTAAVQAGLNVLRAIAPTLKAPEHTAALGHVVAEYEQRLAELVEEGTVQANAHERRESERRFRLAALAAERETVDHLWQRREITDEVHRPLQHLLDHEETMLRGTAALAGD
ncbi:MAG TPA: Na+/H+ antiporter [Opitutaceae bacterium]|nr:Na+/H+ antiporter [Opitutaceae bacterium]